MAKKKTQPPKPTSGGVRPSARPTGRTSAEKAAARETKKRLNKRGATGHG